jgi:hypothetical protein
MVSILCVAPNSHYLDLGVDCWTKERDAYNFTAQNPVITHAPCAQWSRLKAFEKVNQVEKDLAVFCWERVNENGGIFEHPAGSSFFDFVGCNRKRLYSFDLAWWGFPARKRTYLYFNACAPTSFPISFDCIESNVEEMGYGERSLTPERMCRWLIESVKEYA